MLSISSLLHSLAQTRPVFHSEADFQFALAWELQKMVPAAKVRLERPVIADGRVMHVDIWADIGDKCIAVELKYKKRALHAVIDEESFRLTNNAAQDLGRYDFLKDVERIERIAMHVPGAEGYAVLLTNDSSYWNSGRSGTVDTALRIHEGRTLGGELGWGIAASKGTTAGRERALTLSGSYVASWSDYSHIAALPALFRCLIIHVPAVG